MAADTLQRAEEIAVEFSEDDVRILELGVGLVNILIVSPYSCRKIEKGYHQIPEKLSGDETAVGEALGAVL